MSIIYKGVTFLSYEQLCETIGIDYREAVQLADENCISLREAIWATIKKGPDDRITGIQDLDIDINKGIRAISMTQSISIMDNDELNKIQCAIDKFPLEYRDYVKKISTKYYNKLYREGKSKSRIRDIVTNFLNKNRSVIIQKIIEDKNIKLNTKIKNNTLQQAQDKKENIENKVASDTEDKRAIKLKQIKKQAFNERRKERERKWHTLDNKMRRTKNPKANNSELEQLKTIENRIKKQERARKLREKELKMKKEAMIAQAKEDLLFRQVMKRELDAQREAEEKRRKIFEIKNELELDRIRKQKELDAQREAEEWSRELQQRKNVLEQKGVQSIIQELNLRGMSVNNYNDIYELIEKSLQYYYIFDAGYINAMAGADLVLKQLHSVDCIIYKEIRTDMYKGLIAYASGHYASSYTMVNKIKGLSDSMYDDNVNNLSAIKVRNNELKRLYGRLWWFRIEEHKDQLYELIHNIKLGMNSRSAVRYMMGERNFAVIADEYDPSDLCSLLNIPEEWVINEVKKMPPPIDDDYSKLWDRAITMRYTIKMQGEIQKYGSLQSDGI